MSKLKTILTGRAGRTVALILIAALFALRAFNLEQDLPPWGVANYSSIDEGAYSLLALNYYDYATVDPEESVLNYPFYTPPHARINVVGNIGSFLGLQFFGKNYNGLRMPYVTISAINFLLIFLILREMQKQYGSKGKDLEKWLGVCVLLYVCADFIFYLASRIAEPSSVRMLFVQITFYALLKLKNRPKTAFFVLGFLTTFSVFAVYITNIFMFIPCGCLLLLHWSNNGPKEARKAIFIFILGCLSAYALCEAYYLWVWHTFGIINMFKSVSDFSSSVGYTVGGLSARGLIKSVIRYVSANSLLYSLSLLACVLAAIPGCIAVFLKKKDGNALFLLAAFGGFLLQTMASEDYIVRKFIVVYPFTFYLILIVFYYRKFLIAFVRETQIKYPIRWKVGLTAFLSLVFFVCLGAFAFRLFIVDDGTRLDFTRGDKILVLFLGLVPASAALGFFIYKIWAHSRLTARVAVNILAAAFSVNLALNLALTCKFVWISPTYGERDMMISLGEAANGEYILGEYENGLRLYNSIKPVLSDYKTLRGYMEKNPSLLYFDYYDNYPGMREFFDNVLFEDSDYTVIPIQRFTRETQAFGQRRSFALYKLVTKEEAIRQYTKEYAEWTENADPYRKLTGQEEEDNNHRSYTNIHGDLYQDITRPIYVDIYGNIYGDIKAVISGNIFGDIHGNIYAEIKGKVYGKIYGEVRTN